LCDRINPVAIPTRQGDTQKMNGVVLLRHWTNIVAVLAGSALLIGLEIMEEPELTLVEVLLELIQPTLIVIIAVSMMRLSEQVGLQHERQQLMVRDLESARMEGLQWRNSMRELIHGLSEAIDLQFDKWSLTTAEREVGLFILKGMSYKEIAVLRGVSEKTVRQQAHAIFRKGRLSGRAALSAFFLEDLLIPSRPAGSG